MRSECFKTVYMKVQLSPTTKTSSWGIYPFHRVSLEVEVAFSTKLITDKKFKFSKVFRDYCPIMGYREWIRSVCILIILSDLYAIVSSLDHSLSIDLMSCRLKANITR